MFEIDFQPPPPLAGGFGVLSASFNLELAVEATDTGCLGLELRRGGESLGGGADMNAFKRLLLVLPPAVPDVTMLRGGPFLAPVGVFDRRPDGVVALDDLPLARGPLDVGEVKPEVGGLGFPPAAPNLRADPGRLDCAELGREIWVGRGREVGRVLGERGGIGTSRPSS